MRFGPRHHVACLLGMLLIAGAHEASACEQDNDCKGGRVCIKGACVAPPASMPAAPAPLVGARCVREKDCPGDETCVNGVCAPQQAVQSVPAPPPAAPAASRSCERDGDCSLADVCENRRCIPFAQRGASAPPPAPAASASPAKAEPPAAPAAKEGRRGSAEPSHPAGAGAQETFGQRGQVVPLGVISYQNTSYNYPDGTTPGPGNLNSITQFSIAPGLEWFILDQFFIGGRVGYSSRSNKLEGGGSSDSSTLFVGPLMGGNLPFSDRVSLRLTAGFFYYSGTSSSTSSAGTQGTETKQTWFSVLAEAALLFHPASHMFLGLGPYYERQFNSKFTVGTGTESNGINFAFLGVSTVIGGWF